MKKLRLLFRINASLLIISLGIFLIGLFAYETVVTNFFTKQFFVKKLVKVEGTDAVGDGFMTRVPYFILNNERINIYTTNELTIDKYYYVWYNTKTNHTYLTDKNSTTLEIFNFETGEIMILVSFLLALLFFISTKVLRKKLIENYGKESL